MDRYDIKQEVLVRSGKTTTSAWVSEAFLNDWINQAHRWAAGYKPWPYTEGRSQTTYTATEEWSFEGYKADSFRFMRIGGKQIDKINFQDYQLFRENQPDANDRVYSDYGGLVYINPNADVSGTLIAYGQYQPANIPDGDGATADDIETVFTPNGDEGNQAIIETVLSNIANREGNRQAALEKKALAVQMLESLWVRIQDEQFAYKTKDRGQYSWIDVIAGDEQANLIKRDQF